MRGREEWFQERTSCPENDQDEKISENIGEKTSHPSKFFSKLSSNSRFFPAKENSSVSRKVTSSPTIAPAKEYSSAVYRKHFAEVSSSRTVASAKEYSTAVCQKYSAEVSLNPTGASVIGKASVAGRKNSTELFSNETLPASKGIISSDGLKNSMELLSSLLLSASKGNISTADQKTSTKLVSKDTVPNSKENLSNADEKNSIEQLSGETLPISRGNFSITDRKKSIDLFSDEALTPGEKSPTVSCRNSADLIFNESMSSSKENSCAENQQSIPDKSDNSVLIKSTTVPIQMNTIPSVPKRRNSSGGRTRFLIEIQTNAEDITKSKGPNVKETIPKCLEKTGSNVSVTENLIKNNNPEVPIGEMASRQKFNLNNTNNTVASVSPNCRTAAILLPALASTSSFEDKDSMDKKSVKGNETFTKKSSGTSEMESNANKTIATTSDTQFLPKEAFSKNEKATIDKKVAVVNPVNHDSFQANILKTSDTVLKPYFHMPVKEKITNRVHSTYILSPVKENSKPILSNSDSSIVEDVTDSSLDTKFRSRSLIKNIVQWNPKWLEEQAKNKKPPPLVSKGGSDLPLRFSCYDTYLKSFYPMISLEIWEALFRESKPLWLKKEIKNRFYYKVRSNNIKHGVIELQCESIINENLSFLPCEGTIILLGFKEFGNGLENSLFGYIHRHKIEGAHEIEKLKEWQKVPKEWQENAKFWTFNVHIKKSKKNFVTESPDLAYGIVNIKSKLQLADALDEFKDSPIQSEILRPTKDMFSFCKSISKIPRPQLIQKASEEIKKENPTSKLILINAPVATGKTGAIIGIVEKLLFNNPSNMKLLLCAFSDLTVDEIGLRLVELNERCSWRGHSIKFVRFGRSENVPAKLQAYTLEKQVFKMFKEQNIKEYVEREKELKILEDKINDVLFKEQLKTNNKYRFRKSNDLALKHLMDQLQSLKESSPYKNIDPVIRTSYESAILSGSDMVITTLNNCMHPLMRKFFKSCNETSQTCCIIDEISQCTELEVLQCLHPEINRLILVGDLQQLQPNVSSKYAIKCGFKRSMMERILKLFSVQFSFTAPFSLIEQHRMQSQICRFPSKYFYKEQLVTAAGVDEIHQYSPLKPFVVYDILEKEIPSPSVSIEHSEPFIVASICAQILQAVPTASLGVIVAHEDVATMYRIPLSQGNAALKEIEVNTVENFQGIEKDIIIVACINASLFAENDNFLSCEKKMNVAITRARQSLVICGHISSVSLSKHWAALINDAKQRKCFISVSSLRQIPFVIAKSICRMG